MNITLALKNKQKMMKSLAPDQMQENALAACELLKAIASPARLLILCQLVDGEKTVGQLAETLNLRHSAVSQNLAIMRHSEMVHTRRDAQQIWYSIKSVEVKLILQVLYNIYCTVPDLPVPDVAKIKGKRTFRNKTEPLKNEVHKITKPRAKK